MSVLLQEFLPLRYSADMLQFSLCYRPETLRILLLRLPLIVTRSRTPSLQHNTRQSACTHALLFVVNSYHYFRQSATLEMQTPRLRGLNEGR